MLGFEWNVDNLDEKRYHCYFSRDDRIMQQWYEENVYKYILKYKKYLTKENISKYPVFGMPYKKWAVLIDMISSASNPVDFGLFISDQIIAELLKDDLSSTMFKGVIKTYVKKIERFLKYGDLNCLSGFISLSSFITEFLKEILKQYAVLSMTRELKRKEKNNLPLKLDFKEPKNTVILEEDNVWEILKNNSGGVSPKVELDKNLIRKIERDVNDYFNYTKDITSHLNPHRGVPPSISPPSIPHFHNGGFVGDQPHKRNHEVVAKLLKGELVLNEDQLDTIYDFFFNGSTKTYSKNQLQEIKDIADKLDPALITDKIKTEIKDIAQQEKKDLNMIEASIKAITKSYNDRINKKKEELSLLRQQYELEDRNKRLQEIDNKINKVVNDKRYSYITESGEEILTYDKEKYNELIQEREKLVEEYKKQDIIAAKENEIAQLKIEKEHHIQLQNEEMERIKAANEAKVNDLATFLLIVEELHTFQLESMQIHTEVTNEKLQDDLAVWQSYFSQLRSIIAKINAMKASQNIKADTLNTYHDGISSGFVGGQPIDSRHEQIAKLLRGELVLNRFDLDNIPSAIGKAFAYSNSSYDSSKQNFTKNIKNFNFSNINVKADDINEFIKSMEFLVNSE